MRIIKCDICNYELEEHDKLGNDKINFIRSGDYTKQLLHGEHLCFDLCDNCFNHIKNFIKIQKEKYNGKNNEKN